MNAKSLQRVRIPKEALWFLMIAVSYLVLWRQVTNWTGKWPAPYWFSVGLGVLLIYAVLGRQRVELLWVVPVACIAVFIAWFFGLGIYQTWLRELILHDLRWYYRNYWPEKVPVILVVVATAVVMTKHDGIGSLRYFGALAASTALFFMMLFIAEPVCSLFLPPAGTTSHGNYDIFGFRLGLYFLAATTACLIFLKYLLPRAPKINEEKIV